MSVMLLQCCFSWCNCRVNYDVHCSIKIWQCNTCSTFGTQPRCRLDGYWDSFRWLFWHGNWIHCISQNAGLLGVGESFKYQPGSCFSSPYLLLHPLL
ncbi:uncharacterized protein [Cicer arietinum]|uniref:uncharacterized protein isoform X2 n=1 Tax=Cicer arietinum TaxID=3827 RepID=UPI003CC51705